MELPPTPSAAPEPAGRAFVGRERELAELEAHLAAAVAGHGGLVLVGGEPGVGKSRLLSELAARAVARQVLTLWGRCWEEGGAPPYWPWVQVLRAEMRRQAPEDLLAEVGVQSALLSAIIPELASRFGARPPDPAIDAAAGLDSGHRRFALFDAVAAWFRAMAARGPLLLLLDDVHAADRPSLRLLAFLARELRGTPVLLVCAHRDAEVRATPALADILSEASRDGSAVPLAGLPESDVARFVETRAGVRATASVISALHRQTGGNPFFLDEVVRLLVAEGRLMQERAPGARLAVPVRIRDAIDRRLGPLSAECRELLELAAVIGGECGTAQLARAAAKAPVMLLGCLEEARAAGIVSIGAGPGGRVRFRHALFREALYEELGAARRATLHAQVGQTLEQEAETSLAELAHHFLEAARDGSDVRRAVAHARRAAGDATARLGYETAARLYERALHALDGCARPDAALRSELLAELGEALQRTGDVEGAQRIFEDALAIGRRLDPARRGPLVAHAVLGIAGVGAEVGRCDLALVALLDEALAGLDPGDGTLRARLLARLAAELAYAREDTRRQALSAQAVAMAERLGDRVTLGYALAHRHVVLMEPGNAADRQRLASSIIELARRSGDRELAAEGRGWRLFAHLEQGDLAGVEHDLEALGALADESRHPHYLWVAAMFRAMRALLAARFDDAEALASDALALGQRHANPNALVAYGSQLYVLRWGQGRLEEIEPLLRDFVAEDDSSPVWRAALVNLHAVHGRLDEVRARFAPACDAFLGLPRDVTWLPHLYLLGQPCAFVRDHERAGTLLELLAPFAEQQIIAGPGAASFGAAARVVGLLLATLGRWEEALAALDRSEVLNERMGAVAWVAQTVADRAAVLLTRDGADDREAARAALARARGLATRHDVRGVVDAVERLAARLGDEQAPSPADRSRQVLRHEGDHWTIEFAGRPCRLRDSKGMRLLAELLRRPGQELHVAVLVAAADGKPLPQPAALATEEAERHRVSVTRAIHGLLDRIAASNPSLGEHLTRTIRTGMVCSYAPDPRVPTTWEA